MDPGSSSSGMPAWLGLLSVGFLVAANAYFVAAEFALVGSRKTRLDELAQAGDRRAGLARRAVQHLDRYISATQLGITLASLGLGWIGEAALARIMEAPILRLPFPMEAATRHGIAIFLAFSFITALHIILGELIPKAIALLHPEKVSLWIAGPLMAFTWVMALPIGILNGTANRLLKWARIDAPGETERLHSPEEIRMLVEQSHEGGSLQVQDARLLEGVFEFSEKDAEEVMTPRTKVVAFPADLPLEEAADRAVAAELSRYPVYDGTLDQVIGIVLAKDLLGALRKGKEGHVRSLMRPPLFVPATKEVEDVLADMKRVKAHLAIVLDEHGGTLGIVTMEDLLEEIVGSILDEYDEAETAASEVAGALLVEGATAIAEFNNEHDLNLDDSYYNTIGGWVFGRIGRLPRKGDVVEHEEWSFEVARMDGHRVAALIARRPVDGAGADGGPPEATPPG